MAVQQTTTKMTGDFWKNYQNIIEENVIPYQWKALNDELPDTEPSHSIANFRLAAKLIEGKYFGMVFQDSDLYKWLEGVAYTLRNNPDPNLEARADEAIDLIGKAQLKDGYINTYYQVKEGIDKRWTNIRDNHELYCGGHMIEAAVAYYDVTGKEKFLNIAVKFAEHVGQVFGPDEGQIHGYPGHEEIELALIRLYLVTNKTDFLELATFFVDERGKQPQFFEMEAEKSGIGKQKEWHDDFEYSQAETSVRQQKEAVGHAVRAVYLYAAIADLARLNNDESLKKTIETLWYNVVNKKMFINGGIGASSWGESFAGEYDLPNDTTYNETCASIGLAFWAKRMIELEPKGEYADILEKSIYNGSLCGMDLKGERFLYVNPLQIDGESASKRHDHCHVKTTRQKWFNCACCPPNLARLIASIGDYFTTIIDDVIYVNLYGEGETESIWKGNSVILNQETSYPFDGEVKFSFSSETAPIEGKIGFRIPGWSENTVVKINDELVSVEPHKGFLIVNRLWETGDTVELLFDMTPRRNYANTKVTEDIGKVAITRGPLVYVAEEIDNGEELGTLWLTNDPIKAEVNQELLHHAVYLKANGEKLVSKNQETYTFEAPEFKSAEITLIPYFMWGNRENGEIRVWLNQKFV